MPLPVVAIVGAPNVGKSTLFNRMLGHRKAIVSDKPGATRDRNAARCDLFGVSATIVDTGGMVSPTADGLAGQVRLEALKAVEEADVILFLVDARAGLTGLDVEVASILRSSGKPLIPVANKIDAESLEGHQFEAYRLGLGDVVPISAEEGRGLDELIDRIVRVLPARPAPAQDESVPLAIVGRPNVGKSSLFNRLVREDRALVAPLPGTTRDPVDALFEHAGTTYRIIDTAGIRRRARRGEEIEWVSVLKARRALEEAEIAIAMVDASDQVGHQDMAILGLIGQEHTPAVVAANKTDLLRAGDRALRTRLDEIRRTLGFAPHVPVVPVSALTGEGVRVLLETVAVLREESRRRFSTADLNRALQEIVGDKHPPADQGREVRFYDMTQAGGPPPRFIIFGNGRQAGEPYRRYLAAQLRSRLGLRHVPIILSFRRRSSR
ncbi:MAG: ribosome biogenesis GTPase Der [Acidobacteria bacterium]|nr:MAG: ribosome biogenesis GTPase Der [Acidobacteriota bacterium]